MSWSPPERVDDYRILRPLGRGTSGSVYLARDETLERLVALKVLDGHGDPERTLAEARAVARLRHPNVVVVHSVGAIEQRPYIVSEYVPGTPLSQAPRPMPWREVMPIAIGIARGLSAVHGAGLLHRDIKPSNIVLDEYQTPKLIDFGLAIEHLDAEPSAGAEAPSGDAALSTRTDGSSGTGRVAGTPRYMAPELWRGDRHSPRSDVYGVGKLLYELLAGRVDEDAPPLRECMPEIPSPLADVVDACLADELDRRPPHGNELVTELESAREACVLLRLVEPLPVASPEVEEVRRSLHRLVTRPAALVESFYAELFETAPHLRRLFPDNLDGQMRKLGDALRLAVGLLDRPQRLRALLEELGARHIAYGVEAAHFEPVRPLLVRVARRLDADAWSPTLEDAWTRAWNLLLDTMLAGMSRQRSAYSTGGPR